MTSRSIDSARATGLPPPPRRTWLHRAALLILATVLGLGAGWLGFAGPWREPAPEPSPSPGVLWPNPRPIGEFTLQDHRGRAFTRERLDGAWTFMFFGYTHCPDICPTTLATLRRVERDLAGHVSAPRQHVLVSVDPARDTVEHLAGYVSLFGPAFLGVTGEDAALSKLAREVGAVFFRGEPGEDGSYLVDHTASIMLIDPRGRLVAVFGMPHDADSIATRFLELERVVRAAEQRGGPARRGDQSSAHARNPSTSSRTTSWPRTRIRPSFISRAATRENVSG